MVIAAENRDAPLTNFNYLSTRSFSKER